MYLLFFSPLGHLWKSTDDITDQTALQSFNYICKIIVEYERLDSNIDENHRIIYHRNIHELQII